MEDEVTTSADVTGIIALLLAMLPGDRAEMVDLVAEPALSADAERMQRIIERYTPLDPAGFAHAETFYQWYRAAGYEAALREVVTREDWDQGSRRAYEDSRERVTQGRYIVQTFAAANDLPA